MDHLRRDLAPISDAAWARIEEEAARALLHYLAARPLVAFTGLLNDEMPWQERPDTRRDEGECRLAAVC